MRSRNNGGVIGAYQLPNQNYANGVFFIHDAAIYNTGSNPIWPLASSLLYTVSTTGSVTIATANNSGNMKTATFTSNGTFTVNNGSGVLEVLLVGGGGPGGWANNSLSSGYSSAGGGGGGGGVVLLSTWVNPGTTFTVEVGTSTSTTRIQGYPSKISSTTGLNYTVLGGGYGGGVWGGAFAGGNGGSGGGGGSYYSGSSVTQAYGTTGAGVGGTDFMNNGGSATSGVGFSNAGGGGGAGTVGYDSTYSSNTALASAGGDGYLWPRTGYYYGAGGGGGRINSVAGSVYASLGGLSGTGIRTYGTGGTTQTGVFVAATAGQNGYGQGGGGTSQLYPDSALAPGGGGSGTVIFCWRYQ